MEVHFTPELEAKLTHSAAQLVGVAAEVYWVDANHHNDWNRRSSATRRQ